MASWSDKNGKLSKFFACKSSSARDEFVGKLSSIENKYDCKLSHTKIGDRAVRVNCPSDSMKDHTVSRAVDNAYNGTWDAYRGTTKKASLIDVIRAGGRLAGNAVESPPVRAAGRTIKKGPAAAGRWAMDKLVRTPRDLTLGYGVYGRSVLNPGANTPFRDGGFGRVHQLNRIYGEIPNSPNMARGQTPSVAAGGASTIRDRLNHTQRALEKGQSSTFNKLQREQRSILTPADHMSTHLQGVRDLTGNSDTIRSLLTGSPLGIRGRTPLRYEMQRAAQAGDWEYAKALERRMQEIQRNRIIAGGTAVTGAAGYGMYQAGQDSERDARNRASNAPQAVQSLARLMSGAVHPLAPTWAEAMQNNPWATVGAGGAATMLGLYLLLARNNPRNYPHRGGVWA